MSVSTKEGVAKHHVLPMLCIRQPVTAWNVRGTGWCLLVFMMLCCRLCKIHMPSTVVLLIRQIVEVSKVVWGERSWFGELLKRTLSVPWLLLEKTLSHSAIKACASAISACHEGFGVSVDSKILSWSISNMPLGRNVWKCAPLLLLTVMGMWFFHMSSPLSCSGPVGRCVSGCWNSRQLCSFLKCLRALLVHLSNILIIENLRGATLMTKPFCVRCFFTAGIWPCHSRKSTSETNFVNDGSVPLSASEMAVSQCTFHLSFSCFDLPSLSF